MFVKQIDMKLALELAAKGKEVLVMVPDLPDSEGWMDYSMHDTLANMLRGCMFFRQEPAMEPDQAGEDKDPSEDPQEGSPPPTGKRRGAKRAVDIGKLMALHNAGWPVSKIADELKVTERTVYRYLPGKE